MSQKTINICPCHVINPIPLVYTMKFPGAEYWCPACGFKEGMFEGSSIEVPETEDLKKLLIELKEKTKLYLSGQTNEWEYEIKK